MARGGRRADRHPGQVPPGDRPKVLAGLLRDDRGSFLEKHVIAEAAKERLSGRKARLPSAWRRPGEQASNRSDADPVLLQLRRLEEPYVASGVPEALPAGRLDGGQQSRSRFS